MLAVFRHPDTAPDHRCGLGDRDAVERLGLLLPDLKIGHVGFENRGLVRPLRDHLVDDVKLLGIAIAERSKRDAVDQGNDCGVRSDPSARLATLRP